MGTYRVSISGTTIMLFCRYLVFGCLNPQHLACALCTEHTSHEALEAGKAQEAPLAHNRLLIAP